MMRRTCLLALFSVLLFTGCEETVAPVLETEKPFTMWGFLDPTTPSQQIRVFSIDGVLEQVSSDPLPARVSVVRQDTGTEVVLRDSLLAFPDGTFGHVFVGHVPVAFDTRYEVVASHPRGEESRATVFTPPDASPAVVEIRHNRGFARVQIAWTDAPRLLGVRLVYYVNYQRPTDPEPIHVPVTLVSGDVVGSPSSGFAVVFDPSEDFGTILQQEFIPAGRPGFTVEVDSIDVRPFVASANWAPPGGQFDPELLVQPGTFSNVDNGFGFVGGGYEDSFVIQLPDAAARDAGFTVR